MNWGRVGEGWALLVERGVVAGGWVPACAGMTDRGGWLGSCLRRNDGRGRRNDGGANRPYSRRSSGWAIPKSLASS